MSFCKWVQILLAKLCKCEFQLISNPDCYTHRFVVCNPTFTEFAILAWLWLPIFWPEKVKRDNQHRFNIHISLLVFTTKSNSIHLLSQLDIINNSTHYVLTNVILRVKYIFSDVEKNGRRSLLEVWRGEAGSKSRSV